MLSLLRVRNLAVIESLELEPGPGLNVVTGETGAGKSILIAALELVLGGRGRGGLVRAGADRAEVEALFDLSGRPELAKRLREVEPELDVGDELVVRRVLLPGGRTRATVNGRLASATQLAALARGLVDISSQHEHHTLTDPASHLGYLDAWAGLVPAREAVGRAWQAAADAEAALQQALAAHRTRDERMDLLRFQLSEVQALKPQPGEIDALEAEVTRLSHAERLLRAAAGAEAAICGDDGALTDRLCGIIRTVTDAGRHDPALAALADRLDGLCAALEDAGRDLGSYAQDLVADPARLAEARDRLHRLRRLTRRHGDDLDALLRWRAAAEAELADLEGGEGRVDALARARDAARSEALALARGLSSRRRAAAEGLGSAITRELAELGMAAARLFVQVSPLEGGGGLQAEGQRLGPSGVDRVEFVIAANPGEEPRPLARVASGGELSRALLALKRCLAGLGPVGLYVFDEVDTGVGGAVAEVIGRKLAEVARGQQVLCITHSPQVAVYGDRHFFVHKVIEGGRTFSRVSPLDGAGVEAEVARMLGGIEVGEASRAAARDLRAAASAARAA